MRVKRALTVALTGGTVLGSLGTGLYLGLVTGRLTLDLGVGRRTRPLGPLTVDVDAPPEVVYAVATAPYAERRPHAMAEKVEILDRSDHMVLAAHHTPVGRLTAVTVETVSFEPPYRIGFRLVRGPVPLVIETFDIAPVDGGTRLTYTGELGTDLGWLGTRWGNPVARSWVNTVEASLNTIKAESERRNRPGAGDS